MIQYGYSAIGLLICKTVTIIDIQALPISLVDKRKVDL